MTALEAAVKAIKPQDEFLAEHFGMTVEEWRSMHKVPLTERQQIAAVLWDEQCALRGEPRTANAKPTEGSANAGGKQ